jgi:hypothetical protein
VEAIWNQKDSRPRKQSGQKDSRPRKQSGQKDSL